MNRFGCRPVAIAGSLIGAASLALSTLAPNVIVFILVYGVLGGLGFGMVFLPAIICVGLYFESRRALATGIAVCGAGVGAFVFAPLASHLVESVGWRNSNLMFAGLAGLNVFCGLAMRPLEAVTVRDMEDCAAGEEINKKNSVKTIDPLPTIGEDEIFDEEEEDGDFMNNNNNDTSPTKTQIVRNMSLNIATSGDKFSRNYSTPYLRPVPSSGSIMSSGDPRERVGSSWGPVVRPLSRVDIFYSGSIRHIDTENIDTETRGLQTNRQSFVSIGARSRGSSNSIVIPRNSLIPDSGVVNTAQTEKDGLDQKESENAFVNVLKTMLSPSLMTDTKFVLIGVSNLLGFLGFFVPFLYLPSMASSLDSISPDQASLLVSVIGISNTVGRIGCGYISDFAWVDSLAVTNISYFLTGACIIVFPLLSTFTEFIILSLMFGVCIAALVTLTSIVLVDVLGLEKLTSAFGLLIMFRGVATIMGPPLAGAVQQWAGSYNMSFYVAGALLILAGLVSLMADMVRRRDKRAKAEVT